MIELKEGKKHIVIKRDGREEIYNENKMRKVLKWSIKKALLDGNYKIDRKFVTNELVDRMIDEVLQDTQIKIYDRIHISKLFDAVIETCVNKISELQPVWDDVARNLLIQKYYKEVWGIKRDEYPDYLEVVNKGIRNGLDVYKKIRENFTDEELIELGEYIKPERDFGFTSLGLKSFMQKYALKYSKTKILELPQHTYMRLAIKSFMYEKEDRLNMIKKRYDHLSQSFYTEATPRFSEDDMEASCVLMRMGDDSNSIMRTISSVGLYSKFGGGTAVDVGDIRAIGSKVGNSTTSDGVIPYIRMIETVILGFKQGNKRRGACAVYYNWWHYEIQDLIMLKNEGGSEYKRARSLQYGIKLNRLFLDRVINDEEITLFDPKEAPELLETYGDKFEIWYRHYENRLAVRKKKIKARELAYEIARERLETGNIYVFFGDNVNEKSPFEKDIISQSNLCCEVLLPTKPSYKKREKVIQDFETKEFEVDVKYENGLIALCNLSSINVVEWSNLYYDEKEEVAYLLLRSHDNLIDQAFYPVKEGEIHNKMYRPVGIGITNLAYYFAKNKIKFTDEKVYKLQFDIVEDIYYHLLKASVKLAKERGRFEWFNKTKWKDGWLPIDEYYDSVFIKYADGYQKARWDGLRNEVLNYGVRFSTIGAIAPTATSALSIRGGSTESINPPKKLFAIKKGSLSGKQLAPEFNKLRQWYQTSYDVPNEVLLKLAQIRQCFIDQAQSVDTFYANPDSAFEVFKDIIMAEKLGLKTMYYANSLKATEKEVCESCSS